MEQVWKSMEKMDGNDGNLITCQQYDNETCSQNLKEAA